MITLINPFNRQPLREENEMLVDTEGNKFIKTNNVVRFVPQENYTQNFGFQWNKFRETQIDQEGEKLTLSKERFFVQTDWDKEDLTTQNILEVGSGAGRFSQVVLQETKATLYSVDYSDAVTANYINNGHYGNRFHLFQASIYDMPFPDNSFDKVFCFGVLQHTPDFRRSVKCLIDKAKSGGEVAVDFYPITGWWTKVHAKYLFRPFTKKMSHEKLLKKINGNVDWLMGLYNFFERIGIGRLVNRFLPIVDYKAIAPHLSKEKLREWVVLDTFDMYSPEHDHPQRIATVKKWFEENNMKVTFAGFKTFGGKAKVAVVKGIKQSQ